MRELVKQALSPQTLSAMGRAVKGFGAGAGMGGYVGAGLGTAVGAGRGYLQAREQGAGVGAALRSGAVGGVTGGLGGGLLGAAAGGAAGALRPAAARGLASKGFGLQGASNFGQRQVHALTGFGDGDRAYLRSIGSGAADSVKRVRSAEKGLSEAAEGTKAHLKAQRELTTAQRGLEAAERSEELGLNSLPGYARALYRDPRAALSAGARDQWANAGTGGRALMYGLPAVGVGQELTHGTDESGEGRGRFERAGRLLGATASTAFAPVALAGDVALGGALTGAVGRGGRFLDRSLARLTQRRGGSPPLSSPPELNGGGMTQAEHVMSDRAAGVVPEGIGG